MSAAGERSRLLRAALLAAALGAGAPPAAAEIPGKVELDTVDIERLLDLPVESVSRRAESASDAPGAAFVLDAEDLRAQGVRTIAEALRTVPGLFTYEDGHWPSVGVRGVGLLADYDTRILFLVDGHPLNDALGIGRSYVGRDLPIPLAAVRRLEVIKGPVGAVYGPTAFLGVVNVVTQAPGGGGEEVALRAEGADTGTNGGEVEAGLARAGAWGRAVAHASVYGTEGQDRFFPEWSYLRGRDQVPGHLVSGVDTASAANGYLRASALGLDAAGACGWFTRRLPSAPYESLVGDRRTRLATTTCFAQLSVDRRPWEAWEVGGRLAYDQFEYRDAYAYPQPGGGPQVQNAYGMYRDVAHDRWVSSELRARWSAARDLAHVGAGLVGASHWTLQHAYSDALPSLLVDPDGGVGLGPIRKDFRTLDAWVMGDVRVAPGLRVHAGTTLTVHSLFDDRLTSKLAAVWRPSAADTAKLVYAEGFRAPTAAEAFYEDGTDFAASPDLRPERARSVEGIYERRLGDVAAVSASAFWNRYDDLIQFVTVTLPRNAGERQKAVNAGARTTRGVEATATVRWGDRLQGWGGVSLQRSSGAELPNSPALVASAAVATRLPWRPLRLALRVAGTSRRDKDGTALLDGQRTTLPGYVVVGGSAALDVPGVRGLTVELAATNLLDARVLHPVAGDFSPISELPEAGRTVWLGVRWSR